MSTRYFVDTEFTDFIDCQLISIGIVGQDGREFYAEVSDYSDAACNTFVRAAVLPQLGQFSGRSMPFTQLREELLAWLSAVSPKAQPVMCFDFRGDYELVFDLLDGQIPDAWECQLIAGQVDTGQQEAYFRKHGGRHHALYDARANAFAFREEENG